MDIRDYVTPLTVISSLSLLLLISLGVVLVTPEHWGRILNRYMDAVTLASLLVTITILSDLKELQKRYLLQATIDNIQENLIQRAQNLNDVLTSGIDDSQKLLSKELSKEQGILKQVADRTEGVDEDIHQAAERLRKDIDSYRSSPAREPDELYDIWEDTHTLNELLKGLIEESKWKR
jgi:ElaB/YqjD/DUF883 family membrane-anchored ribosome-binding protein